MKNSILKVVTLTLVFITHLYAVAYPNDYDFEWDGLVYNVLSNKDRTVEVTCIHSESPDNNIYVSGDIEVPEKVPYNSNTYTVISIGMGAFNCCDNLISVTIPNTVTSIGVDAFCGCSSLQSVNIPNSVTSIGEYAFSSCKSLTTVTIPKSVAFINRKAFTFCDNLTAINVDSDNDVFSSIDGVLYNKNASSLKCCPGGKTSVTIPNSVTSIGAYAFYSCKKLSSVTIPNSVITIGEGAFGYCYSLTAIALPTSVTSIGSGIFTDCESLTAVTIPNSVTSIGYRAFSYCKSLTTVTIPNSVTSIGQDAFSHCSGLTSVTIPNSVISIGRGAFYNCSKLGAIYMQRDVPIECTPSFSENVTAEAILYVPTGTLRAYKNTNPWRKFWNIVEMDFSGVDEVAEDRGDAIRVENGRIVTEGDALTEVLDLQGRTVYRGYDRVVDNLARGLYVVRSGNNTVKIKL